MIKIQVFPMNKKTKGEQRQQEEAEHSQDPFDDDRGKNIDRTDAGLCDGNAPDDIVPDGSRQKRAQKGGKVVAAHQREKRRIQLFCLQQYLPFVCHEDAIGIDEQEYDHQVTDLNLPESREDFLEVHVSDKQNRDENGKQNLEQEDAVSHGVTGCSSRTESENPWRIIRRQPHPGSAAFPGRISPN
jgi:hypothetical protein